MFSRSLLVHEKPPPPPPILSHSIAHLKSRIPHMICPNMHIRTYVNQGGRDRETAPIGISNNRSLSPFALFPSQPIIPRRPAAAFFFSILYFYLLLPVLKGAHGTIRSGLQLAILCPIRTLHPATPRIDPASVWYSSCFCFFYVFQRKIHVDFGSFAYM
jgi:hypothetical protein